jgi:hypothetical protein
MAAIADRIGPTEAHERMKSKQALLVCAYDDDEKFRKFQLDGAISLAEFREEEESLDKNREIIFY